jgi:hypothetical protein
VFYKNIYFPLFILSLTSFIFLMISATVRPYGFFIDEVYFIACSRRLAWGYIDQPPLSLFLLAPVIKLFGYDLMAIRVLPALAMAATVFMTGLLAKRLGGGVVSMLLSGLAVAFLPIFLVFASFYSMNAYEPLIVVSVIFFMVKMAQEEDPRYWLHVGILSGLGLMMKHTFVLYGFALVLGVLISGKRRLLVSKWLLWGGLACFVIVLPNLIWQAVNGFPSLELYSNSFSSKNIEKGYFEVVLEQVLFVNPAGFPLWLTGLIALMLRKGKTYRFMLFAYLFLIILMVAGRSSRPDRIVSIYIFLLAYGAVAIEQYLRQAWLRVTQAAVAVLLIIGAVVMSPIFCPLMPPAQLKQHISRLGLKIEIEEGKRGEPIPQWLADRIGWEEMAAEVSEVFHNLPEAERKNCVLVSDNYGHAGAMEIYAEKFELPPVYGTHNSFHSWGPPSDSVKTYIGVDIDAEGARQLFETVEVAATVYCPDCTRPQHEVPIYVMRNPVVSIEKMWPEFKEYH